MLVGAGYADGRAAVLCYRSSDQERWTAEGALVESERPESYGARQLAWECPQIVRVGDRQVLLVSVLADGQGGSALAAVGRYRAGRMDVEHWSQLTYGPGHYAPTTFLDADAQPCVLFWIRGIGDPDAGWSGALSIPYRLSLVSGRIVLSPHPVLAGARPDWRRTMGLTWHPAKGASERLSVGSDDHRALELVRDGSTLTITTAAGTITAPMEADHLDVLVDGCVLELATQRGVVGLPLSRLPNEPAVGTGIEPWWP
jgi:beta-fructofuranosidase